MSDRVVHVRIGRAAVEPIFCLDKCFVLPRMYFFCLDKFNTQSHSTQKMKLANHNDANAVCLRRGNNTHESQLQQLAATGLPFASDMRIMWREILSKSPNAFVQRQNDCSISARKKFANFVSHRSPI